MEQINNPSNPQLALETPTGTSITLQQSENIQIDLPALRESSLPSIFPLSSVQISFPSANASFLKQIMVYKIDFCWNQTQKSVARRFSEIENLRNALQSLLPYTFIFPVHRKQLIVVLPELTK